MTALEIMWPSQDAGVALFVYAGAPALLLNMIDPV
jgi:hypothetical protein